MDFNQSWLNELLELQKKAAELSKGKCSADEVQDLVMNTLGKWGIGGLPWNRDSQFRNLYWPLANSESKDNQHFNIDISEKKQNILVRVMIPGIEEAGDLAIKLSGNLLYITGKSNILDENEGAFNRKIRLPAEVTPTGATAVYSDNQLTVTLPKLAADGEIIPLDFAKTKSN